MDTKKVSINAYAKVNLTLDVLKKREDGYHELEGVMQEISLFDEVVIVPAEDIRVSFDAPIPENNTCVKAAGLFLEGSGLGAHISVKKHIPSEAGLGGASADAAAVLKGLNMLYGLHTEKELFDIGLRVGADVPFCLLGGCAVARGVGERLTPVCGMELDLLIVKGSRGVSTGKLFASLDAGREKRSLLSESSLQKTLESIENKDKAALAARLENALTPAASLLAPEIPEYVSRMKLLGALGASMTGSGAAVFGIFPDEKTVRGAMRHFSDCDFAAVCKTRV